MPVWDLDDTLFCRKCENQPPSSEEVEVTENLETPGDKPIVSSIFSEKEQIIGELGKGGKGRINKVYDREVNEQKALKLMKTKFPLFGKELKTNVETEGGYKIIICDGVVIL